MEKITRGYYKCRQLETVRNLPMVEWTRDEISAFGKFRSDALDRFMGDYNRNTIYRTERLIIKEAYWKSSLQRIEFYFYEQGNPRPVKQVLVGTDGEVRII